jgi:hypothetical protein
MNKDKFDSLNINDIKETFNLCKGSFSNIVRYMFCFLGYNKLLSDEYKPPFRRNLSPASSGLKSETSKNSKSISVLTVRFLLAS